MEGDDIKITWMDGIKMHLTLLIKSIQENEKLYFIWCLQKVLKFEVSIISKHTWCNKYNDLKRFTYPYITLFYTCHF